jgi:hypothetical protein
MSMAESKGRTLRMTMVPSWLTLRPGSATLETSSPPHKTIAEPTP